MILRHDHKTLGVECKLLHQKAGGVPLFLLYHTVAGGVERNLHYHI
jgi:hypothetical protein